MTTMQDATVEIQFEDGPGDVRCVAFSGEEAVGAASRFELDVTTGEPLLTPSILGRWLFVRITNGVGCRTVMGVVTLLVRKAGGTYDGRRFVYRLVAESSLAYLGHTRRSRIFQNLSLPEIAKRVLVDGGNSADRVTLRLSGSHSPVPYVVQYDESDARFFRRICERGGLHFYFTAGDDPEVAEEHIVVSDDSRALTPTLPALACVDVGALDAGGLYAQRLRIVGRLRPGRITLRDYNPEQPKLELKAEARAGRLAERGIERYRAPAGFTDNAEGNRRAQQILEADRVDARQVVFESNALAVQPGICVELEPASGHEIVVAQGRFTVVSVRHAFHRAQGYRLTVTAIPQESPLRLPQITRAPRIAGLQSAWVTGPEGEEVFADDLGRIRVRFSWDRNGPTDETSSIPVRVLQANTDGSLMIPRIGWEVWVAFEDGDPERPYVLGRAYNALQSPPYALPANKTVTVLRSFSSPKAGAMNSIEFNDAAGAQSLTVHAGSGKTTTVGGNMRLLVNQAESHSVGATQFVNVSGAEKISVKEGHVVNAGVQLATVGGDQEVGVKGEFAIQVGSETVAIAGSLLEQVGSPAAIAMSLASAGAIALSTSELAKPWLKGKGHLVPMAMQLGQAYSEGGGLGALNAGLTIGLGKVTNLIPGGDALVLGVKENLAGGKMPWEIAEELVWGKDVLKPSPLAAKSAAGGASAGGAGNKEQMITGPVVEIVGGAQATVTPARVDWETSGGAAHLLVGSCHVTACADASQEAFGAALETSGSHFVNVKGGAAIRTVKTVAATQCGVLTINSSADLSALGKTINLTCGDLTLTGGAVTFKCGGSTVSFSGNGMMVESGSIRFTQSSAQSGDAKH